MKIRKRMSKKTPQEAKIMKRRLRNTGLHQKLGALGSPLNCWFFPCALSFSGFHAFAHAVPSVSNAFPYTPPWIMPAGVLRLGSGLRSLQERFFAYSGGPALPLCFTAPCSQSLVFIHLLNKWLPDACYARCRAVCSRCMEEKQNDCNSNNKDAVPDLMKLTSFSLCEEDGEKDKFNKETYPLLSRGSLSRFGNYWIWIQCVK